MLYSHLAELDFSKNIRRNNFLPYEEVNFFFKTRSKLLSLDRSSLDGLPYHYMHGEFYGRACRSLVDQRIMTNGLQFERIYDFGGQGGVAYEYFSSLVPLESYQVVDRWSYQLQSETLLDIGKLPKIHLNSWYDFLKAQKKTDAQVLIIFSFSINESLLQDQLRIIHEIKNVFVNATILILDSAVTVSALSYLGDTDEVLLSLPRELYCFSDGHFLRKKLSAMRLWI